MTVLLKKRVQFLLIVVGIITLSITAEKCRQLVGEEAASKSGSFTVLNCFDGGSGTLACVVKEGVKLYFYSMRTLHAEGKRSEAIEVALADAVAQGMEAKEAAKVAQKEGAKAAKQAKRETKRIIGPIISSGWDFFEALYYGGTMTEGFLRGTGTLFGAYSVGFYGDQRFGRFGYLVGSHLGSWVGGRIGLMVYDVVNGIHFMIQTVQGVTQVHEDSSNSKFFHEGSQDDEDSYVYESTSNSVSDATSKYETPDDESSGSTWSGNSDESSNYEIPTYESFDAHEEL